MKSQMFSRRRASCQHCLSLLIALAMLCPALVAPSAGGAAGPQSGATDPARAYTKWAEDEVFWSVPLSSPSGAYELSVWDLNGGLSNKAQGSWTSGSHDAIAAVSGRILTPEYDSLLYAYRSGTGDLALSYFRAGATFDVTTLSANLASRVTGGTDFFDMAAGDLDGLPTPQDGDYRDEIALAYAQPGTGNRLPIKLSVLSFSTASESAPAPGATATASASGTLDAASIVSGAIKPIDNALAVATGDFDGNGVREIALAYLSSATALTIEVFRDSVTVATNGSVQHTLTRIGGGSITLASGYNWNETISIAAGDYDGDSRDELAVGTTDRATSGDSERVHVRMVRFTGTTTLTMTQASDSVIATGAGGGTWWKVQVAAGLFRVDPANGWNLNRRQIAVAYTRGPDAYVQTIDVDTSMGTTASPACTLAAGKQVWLAVGNVVGSMTSESPYSTLAVSYYYGGRYAVQWMKASSGSAPQLTYSLLVYRDFAAGGRYPVVATDYDGDSMFLGAPVHITVENLVSTDFILEEPPKHAYWDPATNSVVNVSRFEPFAIAMTNSTGQEFSSNSKDTTDFSIGASASASAAQTVEGHASCGIASASVETSLQATAKVGYDYQGHEAEYTSNYADRKAFFSGRTDRDDYLVGRLQTYDIWRYRIYGLAAKDEQGNPTTPFFDIVMPGPYQDLQTRAGGLNFDWYQPTHENGNILSYPAFDTNFINPPDLGTYTIPCPQGDTGCNADGTKSVTGLMLDPVLLFWDQTSNLPNGDGLSFSSASGGGSERSYSHTLSENVSIKASTKTTVGIGSKILGGSATISFSAEFEQHGKTTDGNTSTSNNKTTSSTGITLFKPAGTSGTAYGFYPVLYETTDGTIKATYAADPLASNTGHSFWIQQYGQKPDLALNLPTRFQPAITATGLPIWVPTMSALRKQMRGLFLFKNEISPVTNQYIPLNGAATDGTPVRLEARVYNYSVTQGVPTGALACFDASPYDPLTDTEMASQRQQIGCTTLPYLAPRQMTTASIDWDTTGYGNTSSQMYRIYVVLDPDNRVAEKYETETTATQTYCDSVTQVCVDPGQNNEGFGYATVVVKVPNDPRWGKPQAHVSMARDAVAAINPRGKLTSGNVQAYLGQPLHVRITIDSDTPSTEYSTVLVYDGDPDQGGELIAGKQMFSGQASSAVWLDWIPTTLGPHRLFARVLQSVFDPAPGNNIGELKVEAIPAPPGLTR